MTLATIPARAPLLRDAGAVTAEAQTRLQRAEARLDEALAAVAELNAFLPRARLQLGVSGVVAQGVFDAAAEATSSLTRARASVIQIHNGCEAVRRKFGLPLMSAPQPKDGDGVVEPSAVAA